jgi:hypothetical protein
MQSLHATTVLVNPQPPLPPVPPMAGGAVHGTPSVGSQSSEETGGRSFEHPKKSAAKITTKSGAKQTVHRVGEAEGVMNQRWPP